MRAAAALLLLLLLLLPAAAGASGMDGYLRELAARPGLAGASWGLSVKDSDTGRTVAERNPRLNLPPASAAKLFVTAAALDRLGPEKTFFTGVYLAGPVEGGVLKGDIYIRGGGDFSLGSRLVKDAEPLEAVYAAWAAAARSAGISVVEGAVVGDDSYFDSSQPGSWAWEDIGNYYAAQPSALTVNDGLYELWLRPGAPGEPAPVLRTEPGIPGLEFQNLLRTGPAGSGDNAYIYAFPGQFKAVLRGSVPAGRPEFVIKGALPDPALFAAQGFVSALEKAGIKVSSGARRGAPPAGAALTLLAETPSRPLRAALRVTNKRSFNLYAELLLRHLGGGSPEAGLAEVKEYLAESGAGTDEVRLFDACGLSPRNLVKAETFTAVLAAARKKPYYRELLDSMIYPGDPEAYGHARNLGRGTWLEKNLRLKSGSLGGVRAYAGYLTTKKGRTLVFGSMLTGYAAPPLEIDRLHADLLLELAGKY